MTETERFGPERLPELVEALPVGVFILDGSGAAIYANAAAQSLLGRGVAAGDHAETLAERFAAYRAGTNEPYPTRDMPIVRALAGERTTVDDMEVARNGERIALEVTATPIFEGSRVAFAVAVFQDITARRTAQREVAEARARSAFLMNVSDELRTPLNHIIGFTDLLTERAGDERSRRFAETARASGEELLVKVNAMIEAARVEGDPQLRDLFRHMEWADARVWRAVLAAPLDGTLRERLHHIHIVQRAFFDVWHDRPPDSPRLEDFASLESLRDWARANHAALLAFVDSRPALDRRPRVRFRTRIAGPDSEEATVGETMLQVALHSIYHRGQVNARLREIGGEPPLVDYIAWVWWGRPAAEW